jgi:hypothetical protein
MERLDSQPAKADGTRHTKDTGVENAPAAVQLQADLELVRLRWEVVAGASQLFLAVGVRARRAARTPPAEDVVVVELAAPRLIQGVLAHLRRVQRVQQRQVLVRH